MMATRLQVKRDASSMEFPHVINSPAVRPICIITMSGSLVQSHLSVEKGTLNTELGRAMNLLLVPVECICPLVSTPDPHQGSTPGPHGDFRPLDSLSLCSPHLQTLATSHEFVVGNTLVFLGALLAPKRSLEASQAGLWAESKENWHNFLLKCILGRTLGLFPQMSPCYAFDATGCTVQQQNIVQSFCIRPRAIRCTLLLVRLMSTLSQTS